MPKMYASPPPPFIKKKNPLDKRNKKITEPSKTEWPTSISHMH